jgi:hypothetical protein
MCVSLEETEMEYSKILMVQSQALVAHACNPSYSGSRDQEDHNLKSPLGK